MDLSLWSDQYISRKIKYLNNKISQLPKCSIVNRNGTQYIRVINNKPYYERSTLKEEGKELVSKHNLREDLKKQLVFHKNEWEKRHKDMPLPDVPKAIPYKSIPYQMSIDFFDKCRSNSNTIESDAQYVHKNNIVRSRFEMDGLEALDSLGLEYKYEVTIKTKWKDYSLDAMVAIREKNRCIGIEFGGMFGDNRYMNDVYIKMQSYSDEGLVPWHDVFFLFGGKNWMPDMESIKKAIVYAVENC